MRLGRDRPVTASFTNFGVPVAIRASGRGLLRALQPVLPAQYSTTSEDADAAFAIA